MRLGKTRLRLGWYHRNAWGCDGILVRLTAQSMVLENVRAALEWVTNNDRALGGAAPTPRLQVSDRLAQAIRIIRHHASNEFPARIGDQYGWNIRNPEGAK